MLSTQELISANLIADLAQAIATGQGIEPALAKAKNSFTALCLEGGHNPTTIPMDWDYAETWTTLIALETASQQLRISLLTDNPDLDQLRNIYTQVAALETQAGAAQW